MKAWERGKPENNGECIAWMHEALIVKPHRMKAKGYVGISYGTYCDHMIKKIIVHECSFPAIYSVHVKNIVVLDQIELNTAGMFNGIITMTS